MSVQQDLEDAHGDLAALANRHLAPREMTISIITINDTEFGQMILHDPAYDKRTVASRLRLCAEILDRQR